MQDIVLIVTVDFSKLLMQDSVVTFFDTSFEVVTRAIDVWEWIPVHVQFQIIFILPTTEPVINAGVIIANIIWNAQNTKLGIESE